MKNQQFLDGFKPPRNGKKPFRIESRQFILDGLKPSINMGQEFELWTVLNHPE
jgi:hypothetical protein